MCFCPSSIFGLHVNVGQYQRRRTHCVAAVVALLLHQTTKQMQLHLAREAVKPERCSLTDSEVTFSIGGTS